jgi:hypothetical protein
VERQLQGLAELAAAQLHEQARAHSEEAEALRHAHQEAAATLRSRWV